MFPPESAAFRTPLPNLPQQAESETAKGPPGTDKYLQQHSGLEQQRGPPERKKGEGV